MIYYSKIVKIKMDYITKYQYVKLIHFLRRHHKLIKLYLLKLQQLIIDAKSFSARQTIKLQSSIINTLKEAIFFAYLTIKNASYNIKNILDKFL